jgi:hypothetical protein
MSDTHFYPFGDFHETSDHGAYWTLWCDGEEVCRGSQSYVNNMAHRREIELRLSIAEDRDERLHFLAHGT